MRVGPVSAGSLGFLRSVEQRLRSAQNRSAQNRSAQNTWFATIRCWAQEPSFRSAPARLGEGNCKCSLLERMKQMERMRRFEVVFADLGAALRRTYARHSTADGQFCSLFGGKTCGPCEFQIRTLPSRRQPADTERRPCSADPVLLSRCWLALEKNY